MGSPGSGAGRGVPSVPAGWGCCCLPGSWALRQDVSLWCSAFITWCFAAPGHLLALSSPGLPKGLLKLLVSLTFFLQTSPVGQLF